MRSLLRITLGVAILALIAVPLTAQSQIIRPGSDLWQTPGDGSTFASFALNPLPAGFFCEGSEPFGGKVVFQGVPVATDPADVLGPTDTIIHRLDEASFNHFGVASTRIQMRAMSFEGVELLRNACGTFRVGLELDGEQPITEMKIVQDQPGFGRFLAPIHVNVRMTFTPVDHGGEAKIVKRELRFGPAAHAVWSDVPGDGFVEFGQDLKVDTNSDGTPDTFVPGTSLNFFVGSAAGLDRSGEILRRMDARTQGTADAGSLKESGASVPSQGDGLSRVAGAMVAPEEISPSCHVEDHGTHCPVPVAY